MKKNNFRFLAVGFLLFLITIGFAATASIFVYYYAHKSTQNTFIVALAVFGVILFCSILCVVCDIFRRKYMVEKPTQKILEATKKIASGDFSVKLQPAHIYSKYDEYDLIFDNINTMTAELSKNEMLKNDFISNVSHEIKTPLTVIQNYAKSLQNSRLSDEKKNECISGLVVQTKKLSELISNILKLNKLENQQTNLEMKKFDISETLRISALGFENLFEKKNISLKCDIDDVFVVGAESLMEIVFNNLISNAIKFTPVGGKVKITLKQVENNVVIKVKDSGCGISKEVGERIFEKFYQGDKSRFEEGNGLGLALVKKVIDLVGGKIQVESKVGVGSTFTITLKNNLENN